MVGDVVRQHELAPQRVLLALEACERQLGAKVERHVAQPLLDVVDQ